jgi:hypothetical protein
MMLPALMGRVPFWVHMNASCNGESTPTTNHTAPYGAVPLLHNFQALRARLPSFSPSGTNSERFSRLVHTARSDGKSNSLQRSPHHAHCRMSFILPAVCTIVRPSRPAIKANLPRETPLQTTGTKSACIPAPKDRNHRLANSNRPNDTSSLKCSVPRGRENPHPG